jgi:hypothetical protein
VNAVVSEKEGVSIGAVASKFGHCGSEVLEFVEGVVVGAAIGDEVFAFGGDLDDCVFEGLCQRHQGYTICAQTEVSLNRTHIHGLE